MHINILILQMDQHKQLSQGQFNCSFKTSCGAGDFYCCCLRQVFSRPLSALFYVLWVYSLIFHLLGSYKISIYLFSTLHFKRFKVNQYVGLVPQEESLGCPGNIAVTTDLKAIKLLESKKKSPPLCQCLLQVHLKVILLMAKLLQ